jgi:hypothetical protein
VAVKKKSHITTKIFQNHIVLSSEIIEEQENHTKQQHNKSSKLTVKMFDHNIPRKVQPLKVIQPKNVQETELVVDTNVESLTNKMENVQMTPNNEKSLNEQAESGEKRYFLRVRQSKKELFKSA